MVLHKIEEIIFLLRNGNKLEQKFSAFQGYKHPSILKWKRQTGLSLSLTLKVLRHFDLVTGSRVREIIKTVVANNKNLFDCPECFVLGFGALGKSGDVMRYDFRHTDGVNPAKLVETWRIRELPEKSKLIFIDDLIGTGKQSVTYIQKTLNQLLLPSQEPYLFGLYATSEGITNLMNNTRFKILYGTLLEEKFNYFYSDKNSFFSDEEKIKLLDVNSRLRREGNVDEFDLGLMLAFHFAIPNNSMPMFWKDNYNYNDRSGQAKTWKALLPRQY